MRFVVFLPFAESIGKRKTSIDSYSDPKDRIFSYLSKLSCDYALFWVKSFGRRKKILCSLSSDCIRNHKSSNMSGGEAINLSSEDLMLVQSRIERCLRHYMHKKEAVNFLAVQDNIDPNFTEIIWQQLEEENPEFFKAYYLKLLVKDQILEFNRLLSEQVELMQRIGLSSIEPAINASNGSQISPAQRIPTTSCTMQNARTFKPTEAIMQQPNIFLNCGSQMHDIPRSEAAVYGNIHSQFGFSPQQGSSFMEGQPPPPFVGTVENNSIAHQHQNLNNGRLLEGDGSSPFGFLDQNLSFPELAADDFPDLLEYARDSFVTAAASNFNDAHEHGGCCNSINRFLMI